MGWLFAAVARRVRAMLLADAAVWLEARFRARAADRRAWLLAEADRPLAGVLAAVADLANDRPGAATGRAEVGPGPRALPGRGKVARSGRSR